MSKFAPNAVKIVYFKVCAKAEHAKFMLTYKNVPFEEIHPKDYFGKPWPEIKEEGLLPFNQLPLLVDDEVTLVQTGAIDRYIGRKLGLYPDDAKAAAKVDEIYEGIMHFESYIVICTLSFPLFICIHTSMSLCCMHCSHSFSLSFHSFL